MQRTKVYLLPVYDLVDQTALIKSYMRVNTQTVVAV